VFFKQDGRPIYVEILGKLDMTKLFAATTQERMLKCLVYEYEKFLRERIPACEAATGKTVETSCTILDLNNVGLSNFYRVKGYVGEASTIGQNYCEYLWAFWEGVGVDGGEGRGGEGGGLRLFGERKER